MGDMALNKNTLHSLHRYQEVIATGRMLSWLLKNMKQVPATVKL